jgi:DNA-directed RNA polymerase alpha subunit
MKQFYISCNESRIEHNRSFYGSFSLGPFEGGQSLTIANALRRTLLSELKGLAIVSIQIEGVLHEYSSLPGVKDSVLDILLNLKEIHFFSKMPPHTNLSMLPQIGYLRVRGPGIVRSSDLKLPPFIQLVDPEQYIATLAEDGFLNMKFVISEGKNYIIQKLAKKQTSSPKVPFTKDFSGKAEKPFYLSPDSLNTNNFNKEFDNTNFALLPEASIVKPMGSKLNGENSIIQKRSFLLKKMKQLTGTHFSSLVIPLVWQSQNNTSKKGKAFLRSGAGDPLKGQKQDGLSGSGTTLKRLTQSSLNARPYAVLSSKVPSAKKNPRNEKQKYDSDFSMKVPLANSNPLTLDSVFAPVTKVNYIIEYSEHKTVETSFLYSEEINELFNYLKPLKSVNPTDKKKGSERSFRPKKRLNSSLTEILELKKLLTSINLSNEYVKPSSLKHNVIIEIWTNGSIHPREALYQGLKNLVKVFSNLFNVPSIVETQNIVSEVEKLTHKNQKLKQTKNSHLQLARGLSKTFSGAEGLKKTETLSPFNIIPLNNTCFSSNYTILSLFKNN